MKTIIRVTTIAIKFSDRWTVDTYPRIGAKNDRTFVESFMDEYAGNDIVEVKILESEDFEFEINTFSDAENISKNLLEIVPGINQTFLNY